MHAAHASLSVYWERHEADVRTGPHRMVNSSAELGAWPYSSSPRTLPVNGFTRWTC
jgi:hypothetical protein